MTSGDYHWQPIQPLTELDRAIDLASMRPIYNSWRAAKARLEEAGDKALAGFTERLIRSLSVETGILERLYELDRGTTEALVTKGFAEDLISHASTDVEPSHLIDVLRDQEAGVQLVMDCVSGSRPLTKGLIHELHAVLTRHEESTVAVDQFGQRVEIPLLKGRFKEHPNNPRRPDGGIHEYCPPLQVDSEMDNLLSWFTEYEIEDPIIVSAWLHHRFTQIHPYQDGNGRVARCLITYVLLKSDLLPLVVDRDLRTEYIEALEMSDKGDLSNLALLFARLERAALLQALSVDADADISNERALTSAVINSLALRLGKRQHAKLEELRRVNDVAKELRSLAREQIRAHLNQLSGPLSSIGEPDIRIQDGGPERGNAHWYKYEVIDSASRAGKFANFDENHYFLKATVRVGRERLVFVVSFHHVGRELSGIMETTSFARLESFEDSEDRTLANYDFFPCSLDPFVISYQTRSADIHDSFSRWVDAALAVAIKEYGDRL